MSAISILSDNSLEKLSKIIGETLTGSEITSLFTKVGYNDNPSSTKWRRIFSYFCITQQNYKCSNKVLEFISSVVDPIRFVNNKDSFAFVINELNKILAFSGMQINNNGSFIKTTKASTIDEAHQRASNLHKILFERNIHIDVLKFCKPELLQENYFHAVLEATKSVAQKIRDKSDLNLDGNTLVIEAFNDKKPVLAINKLQTNSELNEQRGFKNLLLGIFAMFRNTTAHEAKVNWSINEIDAIDLLTTLSFIHRKLDIAVKIPYSY